ncbi:hypothetical protein Aperf_G00000017614 [Anoplocephala perfoliata]
MIRHDYDESKGINCVSLSQSVSSNILLLRGEYSTITVAVFGLPYFPALQQTGLAVPNFSVPPPPFVPGGAAFPSLGTIGNIQPTTAQITPVSVNQSWSDSSRLLPPIDVLAASNSSSSTNALISPMIKEVPAVIPSASSPDTKITCAEACEVEAETPNDGKDSGNDVDEFDDIKPANLLEPDDPLLKPAQWRFDPVDLIDLPDESLPAMNCKRLPNPSFTLFEIYKWLLQSDSETAEVATTKAEALDSSLLGPPPPDRSAAEKDASHLLEVCNTYGRGKGKFETEWLNALEEIIPSLPSALAYLSLFKPDSFESASACLVAWSHIGLQLDSALNQPDSVDVLRHLRSGIDLAGILFSTASTPSRFQALNMLLDLLESPLISSPFRLEIIVALERSLSTGVPGFRALVGEGKGDEAPPPYQRIVRFLASNNKSVPVTLACNRLLAKVRFYDNLLQFNEFMRSLKSSTNGGAFIREEVEKVGTLKTFLATISRAIADPESVLSPLPKDVAKLQFLKPTSDPCTVLYKLLDSIHFLDHLVWLLEQNQSSKRTAVNAEPAAQRILSTLLSTPAGLLFIASSPALAGRILRGQVISTLLSSKQQRRFRRLGLEMAVKLEALACVDRLVDITRRNGETGLQRYFSNSSTPDDSDEIYNAVFALARLFLTPTFALWTADLLSTSRGDFFIPCLMLLEAEQRGSSFNPTESNPDETNDGDQVKIEPDTKSTVPEVETSLEKTRASVLSCLGLSKDKVQIGSLLCTIAIGVLRHATDTRYLERFSHRLLQIVQSTQWEERLSSLSPSEIFSYHCSFSSAGSPWLSWLRDAPSTALSTPESRELFSWYCDQLAPLIESLEESTQPPPSLLILLRFLRASFSDLEVIELYSRDGLSTLSTLVDIAAERLIMSSIDNPADLMLMDMMVEGVQILDVFINALIDGVGEEFRDRTPIMSVCKAYAAASKAPSGPLREKIRRKVLNCISAYANACQDEEVVEAGGEKDIWSLVCRDIFVFTTSSPTFFLPGLQLILGLLPLPLPVSSLKELPPVERESLIAKRAWWYRRLTRDLAVEVCGLLEILSASPSYTCFHRHLVLFLDRIASLGPSSTALCQMIAASAVETIVEVYNTVSTENNNPSSGVLEGDVHHQESDTLDFGLPGSSTIKTLTAGTRLILGVQQPLNFPDQPAVASTPIEDDEMVAFGSISNVSAITHSLSFLHLIVRHPICKQALLNLTRTEKFKDHRLLKVFLSILEGLYPPDSLHTAAQSKLLDCFEYLLDPSFGLDKTTNKTDDVKFNLANNLPSVDWLSNLIGCLLTHLHPVGRASTTSAARVLRILHRLTLHDFGFAIIQRHLCQKQHERVFANLLQGLSDCLSGGIINSTSQATLKSFLLLTSALLADPIFAEEALLAASADSSTVTGLSERQLRLSTTRLRQLLHSGSRSEDLVKDVVSRLENLHGNESLRDGMKSLLNLLTVPADQEASNEADASTQQPFMIPPLPSPLPFSELYSSHFSVDHQVTDSSSLASARHELEDGFTSLLNSAISSSSSLNTVNLLEYAEHFCPGVDLQAEIAAMAVAKRRRRRDADDAEATIQHKRRRKGQTADIIQTGRSSKKYVAPMRGRGFTIRPSSQSAISGTGGGTMSTSGVSGPSLLGVAGGTGGRTDNFRSRPQNTSRPPSLHVDDFTKLEKDGGDSSSSTSQDPTYIRDSTVSRTIRGRGGGMVGGGGSQRVLSTLPFVGNASGASSILPTPNVVVPLQSWSGQQNVGHNPHLLTLTNPTPPNRPNSGNMPPRID